MSQTRRLAAILAADVAGYSRLMGADEEGTLARLKALRRELFDPDDRRASGRIVKTTGDGLLVEFASVVDAVRCAVAVQREMAARNAGTPADRRIDFRIGINLGDIIIEEGDIFGDGVNVAARLEALAEPGGICVSGVVHDQVRDKLDLAFDDMGEQQVKEHRAAGAVSHRWRRHAAGRRRPRQPGAPPARQAVDRGLPFQNMSGDPEQEYFADGMVEEIITALSRIRWLFVIARNSSFTYKGQAVDVKQVGRELGVRYVLEGSVRKAGNRVRITAQLIDAETGAHLWADRFDGSLEDVFDLQDKIAISVAGVIEPTLQAAENRPFGRAPDERSHRLRPSICAPSRTGGSYEKDRTLQRSTCFGQAIERDPHYGCSCEGGQLSPVARGQRLDGRPGTNRRGISIWLGGRFGRTPDDPDVSPQGVRARSFRRETSMANASIDPEPFPQPELARVGCGALSGSTPANLISRSSDRATSFAADHVL